MTMRLAIKKGGFFMLAALFAMRAGALASEGFDDLVTIARSGASEEVFIEFLQKSPIHYALSSDELTMLFDLGVPDKVLTTLRNAQSLPPKEKTENQNDGLGVLIANSENQNDDLSNPADSELDAEPIGQYPAGDNADITYFYDSLMPYGSWIYIDDSWYWRPTCAVIDIHWRPYCHHGHWVYTDWGWCWESDYSWGWAPFHYGRWWRHPGYGWVWLPDNYWGPAWVHWRQYDSYYGWAPLPPYSGYHAGLGFTFHGKHVDTGFDFGLSGHHYVFVHGGHFSDLNWRDHRVPHADAGKYFDGSTILHTGYEHRKDHFVNLGPNVDSISKTTGRPIQQFKIADAPYRKGERIQNPSVSGNNYSVYRPNIADKAAQTPAALQAQRDALRQSKEVQRHEQQARTQQQKAESAVSEKRNQYRTAESGAQQKRAEYENMKREQERLERSAKAESDAEQRRKISEAAERQRQQANEARRQQREAERQSEESRKAYDNVQRQNDRQQKDAARERESIQQRQQNAVQDALRQSQRQYLQRQESQSEYRVQPSNRMPAGSTRTPGGTGRGR